LVGGLDNRIVPKQVFSFNTTLISDFKFYSQVQNKFGYFCSADLTETIQNTSYLLAEDLKYIITENSMYIAL
jgi:hypothetical protein